jgi:hypothetical protein
MFLPEVIGQVIRLDVRKSEKLDEKSGFVKVSYNATVGLNAICRDKRPDVFGIGVNLDKDGKCPFKEGDTVSFLIQSMQNTTYGLKVFASHRDCIVIKRGEPVK